jgi:two-component system cell cycle response regulator DivK
MHIQAVVSKGATGLPHRPVGVGGRGQFRFAVLRYRGPRAALDPARLEVSSTAPDKVETNAQEGNDCREPTELNMKLFRDLIEASGYGITRTRNGLRRSTCRAHKPDLIPWISSCRSFRAEVTAAQGRRRTARHPGDRRDRVAMKGDEERIRQGAARPIWKPISVPRFIETIKSYLRRRVMPRQGRRPELA